MLMEQRQDTHVFLSTIAKVLQFLRTEFESSWRPHPAPLSIRINPKSCFFVIYFKQRGGQKAGPMAVNFHYAPAYC